MFPSHESAPKKGVRPTISVPGDAAAAAPLRIDSVIDSVVLTLTTRILMLGFLPCVAR